MTKKTFKKLFFILAVFGLIFGINKVFFKKKRIFSENLKYQKTVFLNDNGLNFNVSTSAETVSGFLKEENIILGKHDQIIPGINSKIFSGVNIEIQKAVKIKIEVDGKIIENYTLAKNVAEVLRENDIMLSRLDQVSPNLSHPPNKDVIVTRINVEEKIEKEEIDFKTIQKKDSKLGWREKKIEQYGEKGIEEVKYKITYENGKEISRMVLEKNKTKEPVEQIEIQGTYVKLGKSSKGQSTWYSFRGGLYAASPWLPLGSYAKVTNTENDKSVIVQINDRGPFGKERIIDLDKIAFQKIASLSTGVINVKVEEILN